MDAVFIDTNRICNKGINSFFGDFEKYSRIANLAQVYIPSIVMEEIRTQKLRELERSLGQFKNNYFCEHFKCDLNGIEDHVEEVIQGLYQNANNEIEHIEYTLKKDPEHTDNLKFLALKNHPPFDKNTDKGFKDAYIFLTIKQFLEGNEKIDVFLFTHDGRLKQAFEKDKRVTVLEEPDEYFSYRQEYFVSDYFLDVLRQGFSEMDEVEEVIELTADSVKDVVLDDDDNWVLSVNLEENGRFRVIVDFATKEIIEIENA